MATLSFRSNVASTPTAILLPIGTGPAPDRTIHDFKSGSVEKLQFVKEAAQKRLQFCIDKIAEAQVYLKELLEIKGRITVVTNAQGVNVEKIVSLDDKDKEEISEGRKRLATLITSLSKQKETLVDFLNEIEPVLTRKIQILLS